MREDKFYELMGEIDPEIIAAADRPVPFRQKRGFKIALIAAVLAIALLVTPIAGAFALAVGYYVTNGDVNSPDAPQDPVQDDAQHAGKPGGLVGELFGGIDWDGVRQSLGADGNVDWKGFFAALQGKPTETVGNSDHVFKAVKLPDGTMKITEFINNGNETIVEIPEKIAGAKVTVIGEGAFKGNPNVTHISIPDTVTVIEPAAFLNCANLLTVDLGESVQEIGDEAFLYCSSLTAINLPDTLHTLGMNAFGKCESLTKIDLPTGLTEIPAYTFYGTPITEICIPSAVTFIGDYAFANCTELSKVTFDTAAVVLSSNPTPRVMGVEYVGAGAFESTAISTITFPSTLTDIYDIDFKGCMELEAVIFTGNAPTVHKEPSADKSAPDNQNAPDYTVYYMLSAQGFSEPKWHGYASELMTCTTEQFVLDHLDDHRYGLIPFHYTEVLGDLNLPDVEDVTVLDSYKEYEAFSHVLTSERYDRNYFKQSAIVLIKVTHTSSEKVLGLAGIGAQLYTTGGIYYLGLYPVVKIDAPEGAQTYDKQYTYILAEVQRSEIRTDDVTRVGSIYAYDVDTYEGSAYHNWFYGK